MMHSRDPATLGRSKHKRRPLDFYPTEAAATVAGLRGLETYLRRSGFPAGWVWWEPFCGDGAISRVLIEQGIGNVLSTDLRLYEGFDPDALLDFKRASLPALKRRGLPMPQVIFSNPPYGTAAAIMAARAINLMSEPRGIVALLCRLDWNAASKRRALFDHPAYAGKIVLRWRPRWIAGSTGSPRFPYAWFLWDWGKDPAARPVELFAERPRGV